MDFSTVKSITIPEGEVMEITCGGVVLWKGGHTNLVPLSTEADGVTIYNGGLGYKNFCRVRSGGAETSYSSSSCTGYIAIKAGDTVYLSGWDVFGATDSSNAINVYDSSYACIGQAAANSSYGIFQTSAKAYSFDSIVENPTGVYTWIVPPDTSITFMRVTGWITDGSKMIVTVNEEIIL